MSKKLMRKKLALMLANLKKKRPFYCELEYLESTGTQYIDTGYKFTSNMRFKINHIPTGSISDNYFTGHYAPDNKMFMGGFYQNKCIWGIGQLQENTINASANQRFVIDMTYTSNSSENTSSVSGTINGQSVSLTSIALQNFVYGLNILAFARNNNGSVGHYLSCKLYSFQIYDNGTLVRDMIPVLDWNYTPCMYDKVSGELFYNQGTGDFTAGREIHYVGYLESTGTQYIDTGFKPSNTAGYYAKFAYSETTDESTVALGARTSGQDNRWWLNISTDVEGIVFGFGPYFSTLTEAPQNTVLEASCNLYNDRKYKYITKNWQGNISTTCPDVPFNAYLYAANVSGVLTLPVQNLKLYSVKFTDGSSLARDFCPAIDENGVGYLFDQVSHTIFDNAGTGNFAYPPVEIEYLESTGTQYIDTGVNADSNLGIETQAQLTTIARDQYMGAMKQEGGSYLRHHLSLGATEIYAYHLYQTRYDFTKDTNKHYIAYNAQEHKLIFDDTVQTTSSDSFDTGLNYWLFKLNNNAGLTFNFAIRLFYFKMYKSGILVRDFIPCYKDGALGMWDKANNVFYQNAGTGTFNVGRILEKEYE